MNIDDFLELLFPGDKILHVPSFRESDVESTVDDFLCSIPHSFIEELKNIDHIEETPDEILKELKNRGVELKPVINNVLYFYENTLKPIFATKSLTSSSSIPLRVSGRSVPYRCKAYFQVNLGNGVFNVIPLISFQMLDIKFSLSSRISS